MKSLATICMPPMHVGRKKALTLILHMIGCLDRDERNYIICSPWASGAPAVVGGWGTLIYLQQFTKTFPSFWSKAYREDEKNLIYRPMLVVVDSLYFKKESAKPQKVSSSLESTSKSFNIPCPG